MSINKKVNKDFFKKWSPETAYVLGFFAADGYMTLNKRGGHFWSIDIVDLKLIEQIRKIIGSEHKISIRKRKEGNVTYRIQIGSIEMCNDLRKLGMKENKTYSLSIPKVPYKFLSHFVRGYFDGDGHVWKGIINKERKTPHLVIQTVFTSCSNIFLEVLRTTLERYEILNGVVSKGKGNYFRLNYSIRGSLKLYDFMYNGLGTSRLFLGRKKDVFEEFVKMRA